MLRKRVVKVRKRIFDIQPSENDVLKGVGDFSEGLKIGFSWNLSGPQKNCDVFACSIKQKNSIVPFAKLENFQLENFGFLPPSHFP